MSDRDDADEVAILERVLATPSAVELREFVRDRLDVQSGEAALSVGCGPGFEPAMLAERRRGWPGTRRGRERRDARRGGRAV